MSFDPRSFDPMSFVPGSFDPMSMNQIKVSLQGMTNTGYRKGIKIIRSTRFRSILDPEIQNTKVLTSFSIILFIPEGTKL